VSRSAGHDAANNYDVHAMDVEAAIVDAAYVQAPKDPTVPRTPGQIVSNTQFMSFYA